MNQKKSITSLNSIEKCLQILSTFTHDRSQLSVNDISNKYQFSPATAYRILNHLEEFGYVSRLKNKEYVVGTQAILLHSVYTHSNHLEKLRPVIDKIRDISSHTASLFIEEDSYCICLYRAHSNIQNHHTLEQGSRLKLTEGASGQVILAYGRRSSDKYGLYKDIRDQGYCLSTNTHNKALFALAVPVISSSDKFVGSIVVSGPKDSFNEGQKKSLLDLLKSQLKGVVNESGKLIIAHK
jgi:DNA-binding IclR family transcriptional regulator